MEKELILKKNVIERLRFIRNLSEEQGVDDFSNSEKRAFIMGADENKLIPSHWYGEIITESVNEDGKWNSNL